MIKTKSEFSEALYQLLQTNKFDDITVNQIIDASNKSRTTFYRYYKDKYQVLEYLFHTKLSPYLNHNREIFNYEQLAKEFIHFAKDNDDLFLNCIEDKQNTLIKLLYNQYIQMLTKIMPPLTNDELDVLYIYLHGTIMSGVSWKRKKITKSADEKLRLFYLAMPEILKDKLK